MRATMEVETANEVKFRNYATELKLLNTWMKC